MLLVLLVAGASSFYPLLHTGMCIALLKNCEIQVEFSRVKKSEDLTEGFNLSRGKGKLSDAALHYLRFRFGYLGATGFVSRRTLCC